MRQKSYAEHVTGDHSDRDAKIRQAMEPQVRQTISSPDVIVEDTDGRHLYYNTIVIRFDERTPKIKILKVVTETDRTPGEVVTWAPQRKGDTIENGVIIYERCGGRLSDKEI